MQSIQAKFKKKWIVRIILWSSIGILGVAIASDALTPTNNGLGVSDITRQQLGDNIINFLSGVQQTKAQADSKLFFTLAPSQNDSMNASSALSPILNKTPQGDLNRLMSGNDLYIEKMLNNSINLDLYNFPQKIRDGDSISGDFGTDFLTNHRNQFCSNDSELENNFFNCTGKNSSDVQFGDLKASSLLNSNTFSGPQSEQAQYFMKAILSSPADDTIANLMQKGGPEKLLPDEKKLLAQAMSAQAQTSLARHSLYSILANRMPNQTSNQSIIGLMENEATRRFINPDWYNNLSQVSKEAILREMAQMESFKLWMEYQKYKQMERIESLLAIQLNNLVKIETEYRKSSSVAATIPTP